MMKSIFTLLALFFGSTLHARPLVVPGEYIVELEAGVNEQSLMQIKEVQGLKPVADKRYIWIDTESQMTPKQLMLKLEDSPFIKRVEPNFIYYINQEAPEFVSPNDSDYSKLWGLKHKLGESGVFDMAAERAWAVTTGSHEVLVAVIDTGIDYNHEDLADNMWINEAEQNGEAGVDDDGNGYIDDIYGYDTADGDADPRDGHGHGTHVAGTIGAVGNNGIGIVGVNWKVRLMAVKAFGNDGSATSESLLEAISYAHKMNARVLNNSWGGLFPSEMTKDLIRETSTSNQVFVAASGNNGFHTDSRNHFPSGYNLPNVISVGATNDSGAIASFSNYGLLSVDVYAPGENIYSCAPNGRYAMMSGTSMAAPHIAGLAALILSHEPGLTANEVKKRIMHTSLYMSDVPREAYKPRLANAYRALKNMIDDEDIPALWEKLELNLSSDHPYKPNQSYEWMILVPGATELSLFIEELRTERDFDTLKIYDAQDNLIAELGGYDIWGDHYSPVIPGDRVRLVFETDEDIQGYGFDIPHISFKGEKLGPIEIAHQ